MSAKLVQTESGAWTTPPGHDALWRWFSLSRASWVTMPRVLMHEMPDEWQAKMADLMKQWDAAWDTDELPDPYVIGRRDGKMAKWPEWVLNYRHPDNDAIKAHRAHTVATP